MLLSEKLCRFCGDNFEAYVFFHSIKDLVAIQKLDLPKVKDEDRVCGYCFGFLDRVQKFCELSIKVQDFFTFISTVTEIDDKKIEEIRQEYEISLRKNQSTDTDSDEGLPYVDKKSTDVVDDHSFTELAEFSEIPTISLNDQSFVIENIAEVDQDDNEIITDEIEISYSAVDDDGNDDEVMTVAVDEKGTETSDDSEKQEQTKDFFETPDFKYICHVCNEQFENFLGLHIHTKKIHDTVPQVQCTCSKILFTRAQLNLHKKLHSSAKSFKCNFCDRIYSHQQSLQNHLKKMHKDDGKVNYNCNSCPRKFDNERKLKVHERCHQSNEKKMIHSCPFTNCDKKFTKSVNVQSHVKTVHIRERNFLCSDCGKSFGTKGALKEHQIIHSSEYPFSCKFCAKKFKNMPRLKTHEDTHDVSQYICNVCGLALNTKRTLKMHMVVHSDNKKFKCQFCQSSFKRSKALKNHLILHTGLRPYKCPWCNKTFANGSNCRSHKKKAHPEELAQFEASGKVITPIIPRLEQLMSNEVKGEQLVVSEQKNEDQYSLIVDGSNIIIQSSTPAMDNYEIQQILPKEMMELK